MATGNDFCNREASLKVSEWRLCAQPIRAGIRMRSGNEAPCGLRRLVQAAPLRRSSLLKASRKAFSVSMARVRTDTPVRRCPLVLSSTG